MEIIGQATGIAPYSRHPAPGKPHLSKSIKISLVCTMNQADFGFKRPCQLKRIHAPFHLHNSHTAVLIRTNLLAIIHWPGPKTES